MAYEDSSLWTAGEFSLADVFAGRAACPPAVRLVVVVAWRPPVPPAVEAPIPPTKEMAVHDDGRRVLARRASDFARPRPEAAAEEQTLRGAWDTALDLLRPLAARRIGALDLAFAAGNDAEAACEDLYRRLPGEEWRVGFARRSRGWSAAIRALELWVLDPGGAGSWLVDVTDLS